VTLPQEIYVLSDQFSSLKVRLNFVPYVIFASQLCTSQQWVLEQPHSPLRGNFIKVRKSHISNVCLAQEVDLHTIATLTDD
jgi:hypothetical protein